MEDWSFSPSGDESEGFADLGLSPAIAANAIQTGFSTTLRVQRSMIPAFLSGRDMLVGSGPGTGKTFGYILPLIHQLQVGLRRLISERCPEL